MHDLPRRPRSDLREVAAMDEGRRLVVGVIIALSIIALIAFARGGAERGNPDA